MYRPLLPAQWLITLYIADPNGRPVAIALDTVSAIETLVMDSAFND